MSRHTLGATSRYKLTTADSKAHGQIQHFTTLSAALLVLASYRKADPDLRATLVRVGR